MTYLMKDANTGYKEVEGQPLDSRNQPFRPWALTPDGQVVFSEWKGGQRDGLTGVMDLALGKMNGKQVVTFSVARARGASDVSVFDGVTAAIAKLEKERPGVHFSQLFNSVDYTKKQYESSISSMIEGAILGSSWCFSSCATGAPRRCRRLPSRFPRSPPSGS